MCVGFTKMTSFFPLVRTQSKMFLDYGLLFFCLFVCGQVIQIITDNLTDYYLFILLFLSFFFYSSLHEDFLKVSI